MAQSKDQAKYILRSTFASLPKMERGKSINLGGDPHKKTFLYCNGLNVHIRDIEDVSKSTTYSDHAASTTVAKYSPNRAYIASGDASGKLRIWDTTQGEQLLFKEYQPISGHLKDICWSDNGERLVVCGEGRENHAVAINRSTGTTWGNLSGHSKAVNRVACTPTRPFGAVTASEDQTVRFYHGTPLSHSATAHDHTNFVNTVKYHKEPDVFITGGADGMAFVFKRIKVDVPDQKIKTKEILENIGSLGGKAHNGQIYDMDFNEEGDEILTVSGDKTAKIWNVESRKLVTEFKLGTELLDMGLGCLWQGNHILVVTLDGHIRYLDRTNPDTPLKVIKGHYSPIQAMVVTSDSQAIYTGANDGQICGWEANTGRCELIQGKGHSSKVIAMTIVDSKLVSIGLDDEVRFTPLQDIDLNTYGSETVKLPSQPRAVAASATATVIACCDHIVVVARGRIVCCLEVKFEPGCVDISPDGKTVVIGTDKDHSLHLYDFDGTKLTTPAKKYDAKDTVSCVKYSPDGKHLVATLMTQKTCVLLKCDGELEEVYSVGGPTGKITALVWNPNCKNYATGSLDGTICVWRLDKKYDANRFCQIKHAHAKKTISALSWLTENSLVSAGFDSNVNIWDVELE